jgi:4-amino-4-deoxychorismate lyase
MTLLALAVSGRGVVDPDSPAVYADDEAFLRGRGAFETARVYGGRPFCLSEHLARLAQSSRRLGLPEVDSASIEELVEAALESAGAPDAVVRVYWTPGREATAEPLAYVLVRDVPPELEEQRARGIKLRPVRVGFEGPGLLGGVKSTSYAVNIAAAEEAKRRGADDAVLVGAGEVVLEGPTSNIWWRRERALFTPGLELGILAGVTRAVLFGLVPALGYDVHEGVFRLEELASAEEAFTTSSVREVMPVASLDGRLFERRTASQRLQDALRQAATGRQLHA